MVLIYASHHTLPSPRYTDEPEEVLGDSNDISHYFLQRGSSQKRRRSVRKDLVMDLQQPLSPTSDMNDTSSSPSSSPPTSSSPMVLSRPSPPLSRPSSPIDFFLRRSPTLRSHFYPKYGKEVDEQAEHVDRIHRARSKSLSLGSAGRSGNLSGVSNYLTVRDKRVTPPDQYGQSELVAPRMKRGAGTTAGISHFRPMPYEVKAELDAFFGQTKGQKRQLALRSKDEDGHLWYDRIERDEFAKLLSSVPNSPLTSSRRSSNAYSPSRSPTFGRPRQASIVLGNFPVTLLKAFDGQDVSCYTYLPLSPRHLLPYGEGAIPESTQPNERRRRRSPTDLRRGNVVLDDEPLKNDFNEDFEQSAKTTNAKQDIAMPAFLPLKRHQADAALLNEAFSQCEDGTVAPVTDAKDTFNPTALTSRTNSRGGKRPANLDLRIKNFEGGSASQLRPKERKSLCFTPGSASPFLNNPFDEGLGHQRRGSSFEIGHLSSPKRMQAEFPYLIETDSPVNDIPTRTMESKEKAAALLGKNVANENLLVPGGLPTGEHVYDGLEIPCRSIHLQSDDEDSDDPIKPRRAFGAVKAWLRSRSGVQEK